jgi:hypothetical protein
MSPAALEASVAGTSLKVGDEALLAAAFSSKRKLAI